MHAVDLADGEAREQPVVDHRLRAGPALFRRLEDEHRRAGEGARLRQMLRGAKQHGGMAVMAAGVHTPAVSRFIRNVGCLRNIDSIYVGPQSDCLAALLAS